METKETLIILRNIFLKCFFIGFLFLIAAVIIYMPCQCFVASLYQNGIGITTSVYYNLWVGFVGLIKTILIFIFLVPALAIHFTVKEVEKKQSETEILN